jgi:hypothetical protein
LVLIGLPANAEVCTPLKVVEGSGTTVQKKVSIPGTPTSRSNWNTDFMVPGGQSFRRYVATMLPLNGGEYNIQMSLKYPNNTADRIYNQKKSLRDSQTLTIVGSPRLDANPYQVNLSIGGIPVVGNAYKLSVSGCR